MDVGNGMLVLLLITEPFDFGEAAENAANQTPYRIPTHELMPPWGSPCRLLSIDVAMVSNPSANVHTMMARMSVSIFAQPQMQWQQGRLMGCSDTDLLQRQRSDIPACIPSVHALLFAHRAALLIALALVHALGVIAAHRGLCRVQYLRAAVSVAALAEAASAPPAGEVTAIVAVAVAGKGRVVKSGEAELMLL